MSATAVRRFSTRNLPERERLSRWREEFGRSIVRVEIEPITDEPFSAEATLRTFPGLRTVMFSGSPVLFNRTQEMTAFGEDSIGLVVNFGQRAAVDHRGRSVALNNGDAYPIITGEPAVLSGRRHLGMLLPRAPMASRVKNVADVSRQIVGETMALRLLVNYLSAMPNKIMPASPKLQAAIVNHVYDLAALSICPETPTDENNLAATAAGRLELAMTYINRHFGFPGLMISAVARDQNISPRYLQMLFETTGSTFSQHVNELRLQRAYAFLTDARYQEERISDIALRSGFSDISHFNRSFHRRFGHTPREIRAGATPQR